VGTQNNNFTSVVKVIESYLMRYVIKDEISTNIRYTESRNKVTNVIGLPRSVMLSKVGGTYNVNSSLSTP
jgi:hypothetical protein